MLFTFFSGSRYWEFNYSEMDENTPEQGRPLTDIGLPRSLKKVLSSSYTCLAIVYIVWFDEMVRLRSIHKSIGLLILWTCLEDEGKGK